MDALYKPLQQQADRLFRQVVDKLDKTGENANRIESLSRDVREDIESNKAPRAIESRIEQLKRELASQRGIDSPAMSPQDARGFEDDYEDLRRDIRKHPNY